ncbi:MAG: hypothetical protein IRZ05_13075 [Micromonosporaceae bacterium]|nr:hypothetical protein [Micromonosporaceae bacterium]
MTRPRVRARYYVEVLVEAGDAAAAASLADRCATLLRDRAPAGVVEVVGPVRLRAWQVLTRRRPGGRAAPAGTIPVARARVEDTLGVRAAELLDAEVAAGRAARRGRGYWLTPAVAERLDRLDAEPDETGVEP